LRERVEKMFKINRDSCPYLFYRRKFYCLYDFEKITEKVIITK